MENQLVRQPMNLPDIMKMAEVFAASGMFVDAKAMGQAFVKIQAGQEIGIPPFAAMSGIHIIQGKPTIGAGLIASTVKGSGKYDYRVVELSEKNCTLDFFQGDQKIGSSSFSIEDAKKAGTKNIDKFPKNMLFARAISNGVKWFTPDVFAGPVYVPEEMEQITDIQHEEIKPNKKKVLTAEKLQSAIEKLPTNPEKVLNSLKTFNLDPIQTDMITKTVFDFCKKLDPISTDAMNLQSAMLEIWPLSQDQINFLNI